MAESTKAILPDQTYSIFQVKSDSEYRLLRFISLSQHQKDAAQFRSRMHDEVVNLFDEVFPDRKAIEDRLEKDGFNVLRGDDGQQVRVKDESMRIAEFGVGFGDGCCWVNGCDTRSLDKLVDWKTYDLVYTGNIPEVMKNHPSELLDSLFRQFNFSYADDYHGRSMSVSDVIVLSQDGKLTSYYVEPFGFKEIPDFLPPENPLRNAEMSMEDDFDMIDGIINNGEKPSIREEMNEYRSMIEAYVHPLPQNKKKDHPDLEH